MSRAAALRTLHKVLESNTELRTLLGHTVGANTVAKGARLVADYAKLDELPVPCILLGLGIDQPKARNNQELATLEVTLQLYAEDVFALAELADALEGAVLEYRSSQAGLPLQLNNLTFGIGQPIPFEVLRVEGVGYQYAISATWAKGDE